MCNVPVAKLEDFIKHISLEKEKLKELNDGNAQMTFFYRGVTDKKYGAKEGLPKIYRNKYIEFEDKIVFETISNRFDYFKNCNTAIEKLEKLQHYTIPTRLLDITSNPLVALYFACKGQENKDKNGKVIIYGMDPKAIKYNNSDTVSVLANLAFMPGKFKINLNKKEKTAENNSGSGKELEEILDNQYYKSNENYQRLIHQIRSEKSYFDYRIKKEHFRDYIICVMPHFNNQRIIAQQGAFLLYGMQDGDKSKPSRIGEKGYKYIFTSEIEIEKDYKENIFGDLVQYGISRESLFPELENYADAIDRKYKNGTNI